MGANRREPPHTLRHVPPLRGPRSGRALPPASCGAQRRTLRRQRGPAVAAREPGPRGAEHRPRHSLGAGSGRLCRPQTWPLGRDRLPKERPAWGAGRGARGAGPAPPRRPRLLRPRAGSGWAALAEARSAAGTTETTAPLGLCPRRRSPRARRRGWSPPASGCSARGVPAPPPPLAAPEPGRTPHSTGPSPRAAHRPRPGGPPLSRAVPTLGPRAQLPSASWARLAAACPWGPTPTSQVLAAPSTRGLPAPGVRSPRRGPRRARAGLSRTCKNAGGGRAASRAPAPAPVGARASFRGPATPACPASAPRAPGPGSARSAAAAAGPGTHHVLEAAPGAGGSEKRAAAGTRAGGRPQPGAGSACSGARRRAPAPGRPPRAVAARLTLSRAVRARGQPAGRAEGAGCGPDPSHRVQPEFESNSSATAQRETGSAVLSGSKHSPATREGHVSSGSLHAGLRTADKRVREPDVLRSSGSKWTLWGTEFPAGRSG
ncbi:hypothetical protein R6Z07F_019394 [Ovis aries]